MFTNTLCWNWDTIMEYDLMLMNILTKRFKQGIKGNKRPKAWGILFGVIIQLTETNQIYYIKKTNNSAWYQLISNTRVIIRFQKVLKCHCLHSMSKKIFFCEFCHQRFRHVFIGYVMIRKRENTYLNTKLNIYILYIFNGMHSHSTINIL